MWPQTRPRLRYTNGYTKAWLAEVAYSCVPNTVLCRKLLVGTSSYRRNRLLPFNEVPPYNGLVAAESNLELAQGSPWKQEVHRSDVVRRTLTEHLKGSEA